MEIPALTFPCLALKACSASSLKGKPLNQKAFFPWTHFKSENNLSLSTYILVSLLVPPIPLTHSFIIISRPQNEYGSTLSSSTLFLIIQSGCVPHFKWWILKWKDSANWVRKKALESEVSTFGSQRKLPSQMQLIQGLHRTQLNLSTLDPFVWILPNITGTHSI